MEALKECSNSYIPRNPKATDLHQIIRENYLQTFYNKEIAGSTMPFHLKREFSRYLTCGILAHGFARFNCGHCQKDKLVAYSCKGRTICPSCTGRRMADTAKHLVEDVIPEVPVRQWVLSMPFKHRFLLSSNPKLLTTIKAIYYRAISGFYKAEAKKIGLLLPKVGAISVIQRFGGALNLNVHFHTLFMDGVYFENEWGNQVFREIIPTDEDIINLVSKVKIRINRAFEKRGYFDSLLPEEASLDDISEDPQLTLLKSESVQNKVDGHQRPEAIGKDCDPPYREFKIKRCAYDNGFSLHANVKILGHQRSSLERLCRYIARGAVPKERVSLTENGKVRLKLKNAYSDGTSHLQFTPEQFIKRLITLIPPPRQNFIRYYGVLGARHKNRSEVTSKANPKKDKSKKQKTYRTPWAELLKRVFKYEVIYCDDCGTKLKLISTITSVSTCKKILDHLHIDSQEVSPKIPRGPPEEFSNFDIIQDDSFNQESNW